MQGLKFPSPLLLRAKCCCSLLSRGLLKGLQWYFAGGSSSCRCPPACVGLGGGGGVLGEGAGRTFWVVCQARLGFWCHRDTQGHLPTHPSPDIEKLLKKEDGGLDNRTYVVWGFWLPASHSGLGHPCAQCLGLRPAEVEVIDTAGL